MRIRSSRQTSQANVPLRQGPSLDSTDIHIRLDVGRIRWIDLPALGTIRQRFSLDQPGRRSSASQPIQAGLRQLLPLMGSSDRVIVARLERRPVGYAVFRIVNRDRRWVLEGVGANLGVYEMQPVCDELVHFGVVAAGLEGTKRLYARAPVDGEFASVLRANGFSSYADEIIFGAPSVPLQRAATRVRRQHRSDVWAIHQLYMATVPQPVQYAEAFTSHRWDINPRFSPSSIQVGWVIEEGYQIVAYLRAESRPDRHVLEFVIDPRRGELFSPLLAGALADLARMAPRQVYIATRGYQQEFAHPLLERGFSIQIEQQLHVKYTTAMARSPVATVVNFPQEAKQTSGKRVPTFLKGSPKGPVAESSSWRAWVGHDSDSHTRGSDDGGVLESPAPTGANPVRG